MISVETKENESLEHALKRFKKKHERAGILREYRRRSSYTKPSVHRRNIEARAMYRQRRADEEA